MIEWQWLKVLQRLEVAVIKNKGILKYLLMMVVSLFLILNFSIGVSASSGYDRQEVDTCITISQRLSVRGGSGRTTSENSTILGNNLAREGRAVGEGEAAAHIVASTGSKRQWEAASSSRELLAKYDIDINDAANGIPLGHPRPHNLTHTRAFHEMVNNRLYTVESNMLSKGYGRKAIRSSLRRELRAIGKEFESGIGN